VLLGDDGALKNLDSLFLALFDPDVNLDGVADLDLGQLRFRAVADNVLQSVHLRFLLLFTDIHSHSIMAEDCPVSCTIPAGLGMNARCRLQRSLHAYICYHNALCNASIFQNFFRCTFCRQALTISAINSSGCVPALAMLCPSPEGVYAQSPARSVTHSPLSQ